MVKKEAESGFNKQVTKTKNISKKTNRRNASVTKLTYPRIIDNKPRTVDFILDNQEQQPKSTPLTRKLLLIIVILATIIALISLRNYSGGVVANTDKFLFTQTDVLQIPYKIIDIKKDPNSAILINYKSNINSNIFAEIEDCSDWKRGKDNDNYVLYAISNIKDANFKLGDALQKTRQQIDIYKTGNLCLIIVNKEPPSSGEFTITAKETDRNIYNIVE